MKLCVFFLGISAVLAVVRADNQVLGCGGFIKASKTIDFSRINVQLFSKAGSLKYETDCAPNNGYFFIPVYEKGEHTIKVSPPLGWKFSPSSVTIEIDGVNDQCSTNVDINFAFDGFGVVGRVLTAGTDSGPEGVTISLLTPRGDKQEVVQTTQTGPGGTYVFTAVPGTDHQVSAGHPTWRFDKSVGAVSMTGDNGQAEDLVVSGFDVRGSVMSGPDPMDGVSILLFGPATASLSPDHCPDNAMTGVAVPQDLTQLCHVFSDNKGEFMFPVVPPGQYKLVPFYKGSHTQFEVSPSTLDLTVHSDSVLLSSPFQITGFSVQGLVLSSTSGSPVSGAEVTLSSPTKELSCVSGSDGHYYLDSLESGSYTLTAKYPGLEFPKVTVSVSPSSPTLPPVTATKYQVSGQLDFSTASHDQARLVVFSSKGRPTVSIPTEKNGAFLVMLPRDTYSLTVKSTPVDEQMGIVFAPLSLDISVTDKPVSNLYFSPVRVTVSGQVKCLGSCPDLSITLKPEGFGQDTTVVAQNGAFNFENQLPGSYVVVVDETGLCWDNSMVTFNIESDPIDNLVFKQSGWIMDVQSSHETVLRYSDTKDVQGELDIPIGHSSHCMPSPGPYKLSTSSCHIFQPDTTSSSWSSGQEVRLRAVRHLVSGRVTSVEEIPDLQMMVTSQQEVQTIALTSPENREGLFYYKFGHNANPYEELTMEPIAAKFLLSPAKLHVRVEDDCQLDSVIFTATKGLFVSGSITPALEGATITLESDQLDQPVTMATDEKGSYSMGPFPRDIKYKVNAEKLGYVITETSTGSFSAKKLASVLVRISDRSGSQLSGVVVSLSGGENNYRTNEQTGPNGSLSFLALSPGEYFVKPVLKEYEFEPKSKLITVKEGAEEIVDIVGTRVAFSLFGSLTSLKGDPEAGVTMEAVGQGDCDKYQEEGSTGQDGKFRIRGLHPSCSYLLGLKTTKSNVHVERTIPAAKPVTIQDGDITGIDMIALRPKTNMDVSLMVKVKKDSIKNIKAKLFCGDSDSPIHTVKMDNQKFYIFPSIPSDGKDCYITVEANANQANQRVKAGRVDFVADKPFEHHMVDIELESSIGRGDIGQASWLTLPLIVLLVTLVLQWDKVSPVVITAMGNVERMVTARRAVSPIRSTVDMSEEDINKAVKFVEASTRKKAKPKKI